MDQAGFQSAIGSLIPDDVELSDLVATYDGDSDTLLVHFYGRGVPGVSVAAGNDAMIRLDSERKRAVGIHIEHFLRVFAEKHPEALDILDFAELRDVDTEQIIRIRRDIASKNKETLVKQLVRALELPSAAAD
jgi:hypothetical protein